MAACYALVAHSASCILTGDRMRWFSYTNHSINRPTRSLYTRRGEISFHTDRGATDFHGAFIVDLIERRLVFTFHWDGDRSRMKTAVVFPVAVDPLDGSRIYRGRDSADRDIEVVENGTLVYCQTCGCWHTE